MLFQGEPVRDTTEYDIDVLVSMAKHGSREIEDPCWQMLVLLEVKDVPIIGKLPMHPVSRIIPVNEMLKTMAKVCDASQSALTGAGVTFNEAMKKYAIGVGVMYQAAMVKEGDPHAEALIQEAMVMGDVSMPEVLPGHVSVNHTLVRHMNGLVYSHFQQRHGEWDDEAPQVRVDYSSRGASMFGDIGLGLNAMADMLGTFVDKKWEDRNG